MTDTSYRLSWLAAVAIALLRIGVGWHFLNEGITKLSEPKPFSGGFFANAKGPLAPYYRNLVWDADGLYRLDEKETLAHWDDYRTRVVNHYDFNEEQAKQADGELKAYEGRLKAFLSANSSDINEYYLWVERKEKNAADPVRELTSLRAHDTRIAGETRKLWSQLVPPIDALWKDFENRLNAIATQEQWEQHGRLPIGKPGRAAMDSETMDAVVPWFDTIIGACLILGLFTAPAALLGAAFLASVCLAQWPLSPGAAPTYYQAIEMLALFALAAIGAGRYFGLDFFFSGWCCVRRSPRTNTDRINSDRGVAR